MCGWKLSDIKCELYDMNAIYIYILYASYKLPDLDTAFIKVGREMGWIGTNLFCPTFQLNLKEFYALN